MRWLKELFFSIYRKIIFLFYDPLGKRFLIGMIVEVWGEKEYTLHSTLPIGCMDGNYAITYADYYCYIGMASRDFMRIYFIYYLLKTRNFDPPIKNLMVSFFNGVLIWSFCAVVKQLFCLYNHSELEYLFIACGCIWFLYKYISLTYNLK
jgi:hypothetical protein